MYTIETHYDLKALTAMGKALRKTIRKKHSKHSHFFGLFAVVLGLLLLLSTGFSGGRSVLTAIAVFTILIALVFEDSLNGYIAKKREMPGMEYAVTSFYEDQYHSATKIAESTFFYETILRLARCGDYIVFVFSPNHGQVYDIKNLKGGSIEAFVAFIEEKTNKHLEIIT